MKSFEIGQPFLAAAATSWNFASVIPGTAASQARSMRVIEKPASPISRWTFAVVATRVGTWPAFESSFENAIEKQPAWAAPASSSGFVPVPSSNRDWNEKAPSQAPLPSFMKPFPLLRSPVQTALAVRAGM